MVTLSQLDDTGRSTSASSDSFSFGSSLSQLANSVISSVAKNAGDSASKRLDALINPTRSSNNAPVPDIAAQAATPGAKFLNISGGSLSAIAVIGGAALIAFLLLRK